MGERRFGNTPTGQVVALTRSGELIGHQIFMAAEDTSTPRRTATSNFFDGWLVPFAMTVLEGAAVEVRRCYCVVTESEFAVPLREQLQIRGFRTDLEDRSHLIFQSRGEN